MAEKRNLPRPAIQRDETGRALLRKCGPLRRDVHRSLCRCAIARSHRSEFDFAAEPATRTSGAPSRTTTSTLSSSGIYLLKPAFRAFYDLSVWVECSFATALERAIARPGRLSPGDGRSVPRPSFRRNRSISRDAPQRAATLIIDNDGAR
jgi:hypothetical protein